MRFTPFDAAYWDNTGTHGVKHAFEAMKAYLSGQKMAPAEYDPEAQACVELSRSSPWILACRDGPRAALPVGFTHSSVARVSIPSTRLHAGLRVLHWNILVRALL